MKMIRFYKKEEDQPKIELSATARSAPVGLRKSTAPTTPPPKVETPPIQISLRPTSKPSTPTSTPTSSANEAPISPISVQLKKTSVEQAKPSTPTSVAPSSPFPVTLRKSTSPSPNVETIPEESQAIKGTNDVDMIRLTLF